MKGALTKVVFILMAAMSQPLFAQEQQLSAAIVDEGDGYRLTYENVSSQTLQMPDFYITDPYKSGYWVFIYNPETKKILEAWAETLPIPGKELPLIDLKPGGIVERRMEKSDLLSYFMVVPKCFYLVTKYRKLIDGKVVSSPASRAIYQCSEERAESLID